jgi:hypothetical protein
MTFHDLAFLGKAKRTTGTEPFSPTNIVNHPAKAWYISTNYASSIWTDITTNAYNMVEHASLDAPVKENNVINGYPALVFTNNWLVNSNLNTGYTNSIYIVAAPYASSWGSYEYIFGTTNNTGGDFEAFVIDPSGDSQYAMFAGGDFAQLTVMPTNRLWNVYTLEYNGIQANFYVNNIEDSENILSQEGSLTGFSVGANHDFTSPFRGKIAEIIIYDSIVSGEGRTNINNYLITKYGLPQTVVDNVMLGEDGTQMLDEGGNEFIEEGI